MTDNNVQNVVETAVDAATNTVETAVENVLERAVENINSDNKIDVNFDDVPDIIKALVEDEQFMNEINTSIDKIMADGKIDKDDTIELVFLILNCYNNFSKFRSTSTLLPELLDDLIMYILNKNNLLKEGEEENVRRMIESAIKLAVLKPKVEKCIKNLKNKLMSCF